MVFGVSINFYLLVCRGTDQGEGKGTDQGGTDQQVKN